MSKNQSQFLSIKFLIDATIHDQVLCPCKQLYLLPRCNWRISLILDIDHITHLKKLIVDWRRLLDETTIFFVSISNTNEKYLLFTMIYLITVLIICLSYSGNGHFHSGFKATTLFELGSQLTSLGMQNYFFINIMILAMQLIPFNFDFTF